MKKINISKNNVDTNLNILFNNFNILSIAFNILFEMLIEKNIITLEEFENRYAETIQKLNNENNNETIN